MKKATPTPKELAKRRLTRHPIMKIDPGELINVPNEINVIPKNSIKNKQYPIKDREIGLCNQRNPFLVPRAIFYKSAKRKKEKPVSFNMAAIKTICDIDPTFYKIIEGRPLRRMDDINVYMSDIRKMLFFKADAAYLLDTIIRIDHSLTFEMEEYQKIDKFYLQCKHEFVQFAKASYNIANATQSKADALALKLKDKSEELDALGFKYVRLNNKLMDITLTYETLCFYRHFLDQLTPSWLTTWFTDSAEYLTSYNKSRLSPQASIVSATSLDLDLVKIYKSCIKRVDFKPFFHDPQKLMNVLEGKRLQCLQYMELRLQSAKSLTTINKYKEELKSRIQYNIKECNRTLKAYRAEIEFMEEKAETYETIFHKILSNTFYKLYASPEASKLFTCISYVHEKLFGGPVDPNDKVSTLMFNIERHYLELLLKLDVLDVAIVKKATNQAFTEDKKSHTNAYRAQRILKESDMLSRSLYASFEPPRRRQ